MLLAHESMDGYGCEGDDSILFLMFAIECVTLVASSLLLLLVFNLDFIRLLLPSLAVLLGVGIGSAECVTGEFFAFWLEGWMIGCDFFIMNCTSLAYSVHLLSI